MTNRDYYEILGVPRSASTDDLKQAFRKLARQYHPDVNDAPDAEERFKKVNEAYAILSDPEKRAAYDRFGHAGERGPGGAPPDFTVDFSDFADIFGEFFGLGRSSRQMRNVPRRGQDLQYRVELSFEEAVFGVDRDGVFFWPYPTALASGRRPALCLSPRKPLKSLKGHRNGWPPPCPRSAIECHLGHPADERRLPVPPGGMA